jgi:SAM-dependent methyltransferase
MIRLPPKRQTSARRFIWSSDYLLMKPLQQAMREALPFVKGRVLDVGCGNQPFHAWFAQADRLMGLDADAVDSRPDIVGDGTGLPFSNSSFQSVVCLQTLEHIPDPFAALAEMARVLKPGGYLMLTVPQAWRVHEPPHDYFRFTNYGLRYLMGRNGLAVERIVPQGGVWALVGQTLLNILPHRHLFHLTAPINLPINLVFSFLDFAWRDTRDTLNYLVLAQKPDVMQPD